MYYVYTAAIMCVSGSELDPCDCPKEFVRFGARCLRLSDQSVKSYEYALFTCILLGGNLATPRSEAENYQMALAAAQLQRGPRRMVWLAIKFQNGGWIIRDTCTTITDHYWADGQPNSLGPYVAYAPPGMAGTPPGWHSQGSGDRNLALCQMDHCYRPECHPRAVGSQLEGQ